jgi:hypothetical protein
MKQSCVSAFARVRRFVALAAVALGLGATSLAAQATGKIEGRVRDNNGAPLQSAQVTIEGTAFAALTNAQGYYFINNVPASTVTLTARLVGYRGTRIAGLKVLAGQTITQDVQLEASPVELAPVTAQAENVLVPRDEVTSKQRIDGRFTDNLPVDRIESVLRLQPGVIADNSGRLSIRGGRADENATYIDGVPVQPGNRGGGQLTQNGASSISPNSTGGGSVVVGTNQFEEASVTTGASSAEFGNAQAGIINISTRTGSATKYETHLAFESDEPFGKKSSVGFNKAEANFGGPLMRGLTFFVGGQLQGQQSQFSGKDRIADPIFVQAGLDTVVTAPNPDGSGTTIQQPIYNYAVYTGSCSQFASSSNAGIASNYGQSCQGVRVPNSQQSSYSFTGRLNYSYGTGSKVSLTGIRSQGLQQLFNYDNINAPNQLRGDQALSQYLTLNWTQNLSKSSERALALDTYLSYQDDRFIRAPLVGDPQGGTLGFWLKGYPFAVSLDNFPIDDSLINDYRRNRPGSRRSPYDVDNLDQYQVIDAFRDNAYGIPGFVESGAPNGTLQLSREKRYIGKGNLDWQFDRYNRLKLGGEYTHYDTRAYTSVLGSSLAFSDAWIEKPNRWNAYIEDRLDLGDVVLVGGLRYDWFHSNALRSPDLFPEIFARPGFDPANPAAQLVPDKSHNYVSPHIQVSFPVTERTNFRLSYAHQVEAPDLGLLYQGINTDVNISNNNQAYSTDLDFSKTIAFEFGIRHAFSDDMVLDVSAYNKDNLANQTVRLFTLVNPATGTSQDVRLLTNADFGNTRGIDVRLDRRIGNFFNGTISYTYQSAKNTGSDPFTFNAFGSRVVNAINDRQPPPQGILPTSNSRPHTLAGAFQISIPNDWKQGSALGSILHGVGLFTTFRYQSGTAYTQCQLNSTTESVLSDAGNCADQPFLGGLNTQRLPAFKDVSARLTKGFRLGRMDLTAYLDGRNILNLDNTIAVFTATKDINNAADRNLAEKSVIDIWRGEAQNTGIYSAADSSIDLSFGGQGHQGCSGYASPEGAADCMSLVRTEERFGNGDGVFTIQEQHAAAGAAYNSYTGRGRRSRFLAQGRTLRLGLELNF